MFLLYLKFANLIGRLYVFILFFIFTKFQKENQKLIFMLSIKYLNFKILWNKKNKIINWIVNNIEFE